MGDPMEHRPGAEPEDLVTWLTGEAEQASRDANKFRADGMDALCSGRDSGALFDAETRAEGMALAFRLAATKAQFARRRAKGQDRPVEPVTVLGAATVGDHRGVLVQRSGAWLLLLPDGLETPPLDSVPRYDSCREAWLPLIREHDDARRALEDVA